MTDPRQMSLRELLSTSDHSVRELTEHLSLSFVPRVARLGKQTKSYNRPEERAQIPDVTIRNSAAEVIQSDDFSQTLYEKLNTVFWVLEQAAGRAAGE